jgi:hypothetical protein
MHLYTLEFSNAFVNYTQEKLENALQVCLQSYNFYLKLLALPSFRIRIGIKIESWIRILNRIGISTLLIDNSSFLLEEIYFLIRMLKKFQNFFSSLPRIL